MMSDNYTTEDLAQPGLEEMAYERDLAAQTARAETTARQLRDCRDDLKTVIDRAEDTTRWLFKQTADNAALRAQLDAGEGWCSVDDDPDEYNWYLTYDAAAEDLDNAGMNVSFFDGNWERPCTHYRPLPAPPKD